MNNKFKTTNTNSFRFPLAPPPYSPSRAKDSSKQYAPISNFYLTSSPKDVQLPISSIPPRDAPKPEIFDPTNSKMSQVSNVNTSQVCIDIKHFENLI